MASNQPDSNATVSIFALGKVVATRCAYEALQEAGGDPAIYLRYHECGDWGGVDAEDATENDRSLGLGLRILSAYTLTTGERIWIITEAVRFYTTLMLPEEY